MAKKPQPDPEPLPTGFVTVMTGTGLETAFAPWHVVAMEAQSTARHVKIILHSRTGTHGIGAVGYTLDEIQRMVWDGVKRSAAAALLAQMHDAGTAEALDGLAEIVGHRVESRVDGKIREQLQDGIRRQVLEVMANLDKESEKT